jgi:DNA-3-methyladenine glycosylase II
VTDDATDSNDPHEHLRSDPALAPLVETYGPLALEPHEDPFRRLVVSVLRQQVSMDAAAAIRERLFDRVEVTPAGILAAEETAMRDAGVSGTKVGYLRAIAERWDEQAYDRAFFEGMDDAAVRAELKAVRGVGDWTADVFLMFGLGRKDVFPVGDLGIRKAMRRQFEVETRAAMVERAERWRPYRSYASLYLWQDGD